MSSYTDLRKYHDDFRFLKEMKTLMMEEVCRMRAEISDPTFWDSQVRRGFFTETEDGRDVRIVLPKGVHAVTELFHPYVAGHEGVKDLMRSECGITTPTAIHFVGFIGTRLTASQTHEGVEKGVMSMDDVLIAELAEIDGMLAYVTGERVKGGDRGNLVLFRDWGVVHELLKSKNHDAAVSSLSPRYYSDVRIHSGTLPDGMTSSFFELRKTLFLCFTLPPEDPGRRRVQMWRACREDSDVVKVRPRSDVPTLR